MEATDPLGTLGPVVRPRVLNSGRPERLRLLVTALAALWLPFVVWGPLVFDGTDAARGNLDRAIPAIGVLGVVSVAMAVLCVAAGFSTGSMRLIRATLIASALWWLFFTLMLFQADLVVAGGLAAAGFTSAVISYGMALTDD